MRETMPLSSVCLRITKGTTPTTLGHKFEIAGINFVKSESVTSDGRIDPSKFSYISETTHEALKRSILEVEDVLFSMAGVYLGKTAVVAASILPANTNQAVGIIRLDKKMANPRFVHYAISSQQCRDYIRRSVAQSAQPNFNLQDIGRLQIPNFPLAEQRAIGETLGALDNKIDSNRRAVASASDLINALATQMVDTKATHTVALSEIVEFNRITVRPGAPDDPLLYIDIASVSPGSINVKSHTTWGKAPSRARRGVNDGDVIYSTVRPGRRSFAQVLDPDERTVVSTGFAVMSPSAAIGSSLLTTIAGSLEFAAYLESVAHGSAYPAVSIEAMGNYQIEIPTDGTAVAEFEAATMPLRRRTHQAELENIVLAELRDTLLPELFSSRIRVSEAADAIDKAKRERLQ